MKKRKKGYFGFREVYNDEKKHLVNNLFHIVSKRYDIMNDVMSFGIHRLWKNFLVKYSGVRSGYKVLDVAGGTGDLTIKFSRLVGKDGIVVLLDFNDSMITIARKKLRDLGIVDNVYYVQADAEYLPFLDNVFDCVSISFGLRNLAEKELSLSSMYRVLKPGGRLLVLDFSQPVCNFVDEIYDFYSFCVIPYLGQLIVRDFDSYRYLVESIRMHPDQKHLLNMISEAGFKNVEYFNMFFGITVLHRGYK
ncbi:bifunctional demethylmenaquinone methyltransferase/2-methoxy-6-polyprenyl-1,4-benzoquinol methylase UbiE [Blochmannia endosymbiont of Polyrhachis (Hedomyrma) turneri]|uniref:bifunctional demethylmenaquinone methyltransferase/2-methoxy-6-polyprenyl-1,4-benzoquinol methylase UbiE n=1 Tax=Blochmannia endosymbiont of Polyrhachis (Hedomyrma) turneri TaxID=1505596 RepID=UPI00061A7C50|nr:bifunctional demethylmenaquinone methyltransferase/2-methoxy-6-polyprenyl-1,4-benzoquinol methylase UbiE [Blochmannia endosymbiont of Polyrhachis (Hedomyrma) turneri]AKC60177.1 ubiquinone/menaquinone biosynthesis methyltransferase ubiE [Blochmannia endosymbiont of Polyrhachis (Hedomyrma) turneri]